MLENIKIFKINAINSKSGIVSKDGSRVYSNDIFLDNVEIPFASYQKKPQYGHGLLVVNNFKVDNFLIKFAKDKRSEIILNNVNQISSKNNEEIVASIKN